MVHPCGLMKTTEQPWHHRTTGALVGQQPREEARNTGEPLQTTQDPPDASKPQGTPDKNQTEEMLKTRA